MHWNVEFGMWSSTFQFPFQNFGMWNMECGHSEEDNSMFHIPKFWNWNWNCLFQNVSPLTMLKCMGMWNVECGNPHFIFPFQNFGMWNVEIHIPIPIPEFWNRNMECGFHFHIPYSTFQCTLAWLEWDVLKRDNSTFHIPKFWNRNMECGIPHSIFHIPMHFSMVGVRCSQKDKSTFHIPKFWNKNWNGEFTSHVPHSNALMLKWYCGIPHSTFRNSGMGIGMCVSTFHIPHSNAL